jgi:hypothetical protein
MDMSKFCVFTFIYLDVRDVDPIPNMVTSPYTSVPNANIFWGWSMIMIQTYDENTILLNKHAYRLKSHKIILKCEN